MEFLGQHATNSNGRMMLEFAEKWNLVMLNVDDRCEGVYTRVQGEERTVLDYCLVDEAMYGKFCGMEIDEGKELFDLSDHCLVRVHFRLGIQREGDKVGRNRTFYKINDRNRMQRFVGEVEEKFEEEADMSVTEMEDQIRGAADKHLKCSVNGGRNNGKNKKIEQPWMNEAIKGEIKKRRELNRNKRLEEGEAYERAWQLYKHQKELTKRLVKEEKMKYERRLASEIRESRDQRNMWDKLKKLRGEGTGKQRTDLYGSDGQKVELQREGVEMTEYWKTVYQKEVNKIPEIWNEERAAEYRERRRVGMAQRELQVENGVSTLRLVAGGGGWRCGWMMWNLRGRIWRGE